jgi:hypothetical protein
LAFGNGPIKGRRLAYNHLTQMERAKLGAEIFDRRLPVENLTMRQTEAIVGAPASSINRHRTGRQHRKPFKLAKHIAKASPEEFENAVEVLGPELIFVLFFGRRLPL